MNVHKNARLTPLGRERLVKQVLGRLLTPAAAAAGAGISARTIYKWLSRFKNEGADGTSRSTLEAKAAALQPE